MTLNKSLNSKIVPIPLIMVERFDENPTTVETEERAICMIEKSELYHSANLQIL